MPTIREPGRLRQEDHYLQAIPLLHRGTVRRGKQTNRGWKVTNKGLLSDFQLTQYNKDWRSEPGWDRVTTKAQADGPGP